MAFVKSKIKGRGFGSSIARLVDRTIDVKGQDDRNFSRKKINVRKGRR